MLNLGKFRNNHLFYQRKYQTSSSTNYILFSNSTQSHNITGIDLFFNEERLQVKTSQIERDISFIQAHSSIFKVCTILLRLRHG